MNISHLKYAVEVEKTGSITQAADNLFMGQPNLSKAIKELEETLGIVIFKRSSKGVIPTNKGKEFLSYAKNILSQIDEMESLYKPENKNKISFNISVPRAGYLNYAFTNFVNKLDNDKEIDVNFKETNNMKTINNIMQHEYNLGIIRYQAMHEKYFLNMLLDKDIHYNIIWEFEHLALMSKEHELAFRDEVMYQELKNYIEVVHGELAVSSLPLTDIKKSEQTEHTKKRICVYERGSQFDLLHRVPTAYMWASPLPENLIDDHGLVQRKCSVANQKYKDALIYLKGYKLNELEKSFVEELDKVRDEMTKQIYK